MKAATVVRLVGNQRLITTVFFLFHLINLLLGGLSCPLKENIPSRRTDKFYFPRIKHVYVNTHSPRHSVILFLVFFLILLPFLHRRHSNRLREPNRVLYSTSNRINMQPREYRKSFKFKRERYFCITASRERINLQLQGVYADLNNLNGTRGVVVLQAYPRIVRWSV